MPFPTEMDTSLQQCSKLLSVKGAHDTVHTGAIFPTGLLALCSRQCAGTLPHLTPIVRTWLAAGGRAKTAQRLLLGSPLTLPKRPVGNPISSNMHTARNAGHACQDNAQNAACVTQQLYSRHASTAAADLSGTPVTLTLHNLRRGNTAVAAPAQTSPGDGFGTSPSPTLTHFFFFVQP